MDSITKPVCRLGCMLMACFSMACTSTQPTSGETLLPSGETTSFSIVNSEIRMVFSHNMNITAVDEEEMPGFSVSFTRSGHMTPVRIYFNNEDCDAFVSYSVGVQRASGVTYEYFDNAIPAHADIDIQMTVDDDGNQVLLVNNHRTPLDIKRRPRRLEVDTVGDHSLSFTGLTPLDTNKEK